MGKHKSYNARFKLRAVEIATKKSKMAASREFGVDPKRIREWCKQKESLMKLKNEGKSKKKRLCGEGRKANEDSDMEDTLFDWVMYTWIHVLRERLRVSALKKEQMLVILKLVNIKYSSNFDCKL